MSGFLQRRVREVLAFAVLAGAGLTGLRGQVGDAALQQFYQANALYNKRLYPLAADEFRAFLGKNPTHAKADAARFGLALCQFAQKDYAGAEPVLKSLDGKLEPAQQGEIILMHGQCLLELGRANEAEQRFTAGITRLADAGFKSRCQAGLVEALYRQQKWDDLGKQAEAFLKDNREGPLATRVRTQAALGAFEHKDFSTAASLLEILGARDQKLGQQGVFLLAESKRQLGDRDAARQGFETARKMEGAYQGEALLRLGFMSFEDRQFDQAASLLEEFKAKNPKAPSMPAASIYLGRAYLEKNDLNRAKSAFATVDSAEALLWRARCAQREQKPDEAIGFLRDATNRFAADPLAPDLFFELGNTLMAREKFADAADAFGKIATRPAALHLRAFCLHRAGKYGESLAACDEFVARVKEPEKQAAEEIPFLRAENLFLLNRPDEAVAAFQQFLSRFPQSPNLATAHLRIGESRYQQQRWAEAAVGFQAAIARDPKREGIFLPLDFYAGECLAATGQPDQAIPLYEKFLAATPADAPRRDTALFKIASIHGANNRAADAVRRYEELADKHPKSPLRPESLLEIGRLALTLNDLGKANRALEQFTQLYGKHELRSQAEYYLGWVALGEKRGDDARKHFRAVAKAPDAILFDARFQTGMLALASGDLKAAALALRELPPGKVEPVKLNDLRFRLGLAQVREGRWAEARKTLTALLEAQPDPKQRAQARYELAWCDKQLNDPKSAIDQYQELLKQDPGSELAPQAALELAELEYEGGNAPAAASRLLPLLASPDTAVAARAAYRLGWCQFDARQFAEAAGSFEKVLAGARAVPDLVSAAAYQAGEARREAREYPAAIADYARAAAAKALPGDLLPQQALLRMAETQGLNGQYNDSLSSCERFIAGYPESTLLRRARFARGWALENLLRHPEAIAAYQEVLAEAKPDETAARAQFQIGECFLAHNDFDQALKELIKVEVNFGKNEWTPKALLEMGTALERKNDPLNARARYQEVIQGYPDSPSAAVAKKRLDALPPKP